MYIKVSLYCVCLSMLATYLVSLTVSIPYLAVTYYYPGRILGWELTTLFLFLFIDGVRLLLGMSACALPWGSIYIIMLWWLCSLERQQDLHVEPTHQLPRPLHPYDYSPLLLYITSDLHVRVISLLTRRNKLTYHFFMTMLSFILCNWYRLRVDVVLNAIAFFFLGSEIIFSVMVLVNIISESRKFWTLCWLTVRPHLYR